MKVQMGAAVPAGDNNIGNVDVLTLPALPAGSAIIGQVKLTDGTDMLLINTNGSINIVPVNSAGAELFSTANPAQVQIAKTFKLAWNTPVYFISDTAGQSLSVIETSATTYEPGIKTIGTTGIEVFAGASNRLTNRADMLVTVSSTNTGNTYLIKSGGTVATGYKIPNGDSIGIEFSA